MQVYGQRTSRDVWPAFYEFVDFIIRMIDEGKVEVISNSSFGTSHDHADFYIWLSVNMGVHEESKIHFSYDWWLGCETATPIRRFGFSLVNKGLVLAELRSRDANSYDKMLDLFRAVMRYMERHNPSYHKVVLEFVSKSISSLDRKDWQKSRKDIESEFEKEYQAREAREKFERERTEKLSNLVREYKNQGYQIID
ncbi:MAG: hypothetical protein Q8R55_02015 [Candidatus Taylorbacteria bacterium]|nr:hypothetical protein [Candidatus Taylorbacteria bacterium]